MSDASSVGLSLEEARIAYSHVATDAKEKDWIAGLNLVLPASTADERDKDYEALAHSADWYLEPLRTLQPRSFEAFYRQGNPSLVLLEAVWDDVQFGKLNHWGLFLSANERLIQITTGDGRDGYCLRFEFDEALSLPDSLSRSWLWRVSGWRICASLPCPPMTNRQMIRTMTEGIDAVIESLDVPKRERPRLLSGLATRFPDIAPARNNGRWNLRCFLDTRPMGVGGGVGDQLFTRMKMRDGVVYRVRNGDVAGLHVLDNPGEAIDCYHQHLLLKRPGEFDFSPWAQPL
jgi:hypothetical protein